jgi:hypothetical protein
VALTLTIFLSSVVLCTGTFLSDDALKAIGVSAAAERVLMGTFSSIILFVSIAELCVRWGEKSQRYSDAAERLASIKARTRQALVQQNPISEPDCADLTRSFSAAMEGLPRIPDRQFVSLKAHHLKKVRISQMCEQAVGCPVWILRCRLAISGIRSGWTSPGGKAAGPLTSDETEPK